MKRTWFALFVTVLTAVLGVVPASASAGPGARTFAQVKQAAAAPVSLSSRAHPRRVKPPVSTAGPAPAGRQARGTARSTTPAAAALAPVGGSWTSLGPRPISSPAHVNAFQYGDVSGRVTALAVDPTSASTVYAGTAGGGVWKTIDAGVTWNPMSDSQASGGIGAIAIDPSNSQIVYAATGEDNDCLDICAPSKGVLKSTNGGSTWTLLGSATFDTSAVGSYFFFGSIAVDSATPLHLLAATNLGLYASADGGVSWTRNSQLQTVIAASGTASPNGTVMQAVQDIVLPNRWWAAASDWCTTEGGDIIVSVDSGATWSVSRTFADVPGGILGGAERISLGVGPGTGGSTVYAEVSSCSGSGGNGPFRYVEGAGWTTVAETSTNVMSPLGAGNIAQGFWDNTVAVDPANAAHVLVGGITVIASSNSGASWTDVGQVYSGPSGPVHPDFHAFAFVPAGGTAYAANDGGIWKTSNLGTTWTNLNATLQLTQYYAGFARDLTTFAGGAQDNGTSGRYTGGPAAPALGLINGGDGGWAQYRGGTQYYTEAQGNDMQIIDTSKLATASANYTENGPCDHGTNIGTACGDRTAFVTPFVTSPGATDTLYVGTYRVWRSGNGGLPAGGANWTAISGDLTAPPTPPLLPSDTIAQMAIRHIGGHDIVVTGSQSGRVFMSSNAEAVTPVWTEITGNLPPAAANSIALNSYISAITVNPANASEVWVALGTLAVGRVWHTVTAGTTNSWTDLSGTGATALPVAITKSIAVNPNQTSTLLVGTDSGAFACYTCSGAAVPAWTQLGSGLPTTRIQSLSVTDDGLNVLAWTHGRGVWTMPIPADSLTVTTSTATPTVGTAFTVTVAAHRPDGPADGAYRGTVHFTSSDTNTPVLPPDYAFTSADSGSHTFTGGVILSTAGTQTVTATDIANPAITGTSPALTVAAIKAGAPVIGTATAGASSATVTWTAPSSTGGTTLSGYQVTPYIGVTPQTAVLTGSTAISFTVLNLTPGTAYTFTVAAVNSAGTGPESAHSNSVTPYTVPGAPTGVTGTPGNGQVSLSWTAPSNGGSPITGYRVTPYIGATAQTPRPTNSTLTSYVVTVTNGPTYTFTVAALNVAGAGPDSSPSGPVTPGVPCSSVTLSAVPLSAAPVGGSVTVTGSASGCSNPLYEFWMLSPGSSTWQMAQAYSSSANFNWNTAGKALGNYTFVVWAKDASSAANYDAFSSGLSYTLTTAACSAAGITASPATAAAIGTPVTITGSATRCPNPTYEFWMLAPGSSTWQLAQGYSAGATYSWNTAGKAAGAYTFVAWARNAGSAANYEAFSPGLSYTLTTGACSSAGIAASPSTAAAMGTPVTITGNAAGCPSPTYEFWMLAPGSSTWQLAQGYSASATFSWNTAGKALGAYSFVAWVRNAGSAANYEAFSPGLAYTLTSGACSSVGLSASPAGGATVGTPVTVSGNAAGCPSPTYEFWMLAPGSSTWQLAQAYSASATYSWNTAGLPAGSYTFVVWARNAGSPANYEAFSGGLTYTLR